MRANLLTSLLFGFTITMVAGCKPTPKQPDPDPQEQAIKACANLRKLRCESADPSPEGRPCEYFMTEASKTGDVDLSCVVSAHTCGQAEACTRLFLPSRGPTNMAQDTTRAFVEENLAKYEKTLDEIAALEAENHAVQRFIRLQQEADSIKDAVRSVLHARPNIEGKTLVPIAQGRAFRVTCTYTKDNGRYEPARLPAWLLQMAGVVTSVDEKVVATIAANAASEDDKKTIAAAYVPPAPRTPQVRIERLR